MDISLIPPTPHSSPNPSPSPSYGSELCEDEVCCKFPALLARQPLGSPPTFCKSSLANQNSCRQSPDPEFPDKEMFMLRSLLFFEQSPLPRVGGKKLQPYIGFKGSCVGVYGYVHCIICLLTLWWRACIRDEPAYSERNKLTSGISTRVATAHLLSLGSLKGNGLFMKGK